MNKEQFEKHLKALILLYYKSSNKVFSSVSEYTK